MTGAVLALALGWAHNDFQHARPLRDAVEHGFCAVEADVYLKDGNLRIAHVPWRSDPGRTLESLYLKPLETTDVSACERFHLVVDFKSHSAAALRTLEAELSRARLPKNVRVLISGWYPRSEARIDGKLYAIDGRLDDIGKDARIFPVISAPLPWFWPVRIPPLILKAHLSGHKIRFWGAREEPWAVKALADLGVDYLCVDELGAYSRWRSSAARAQ